MQYKPFMEAENSLHDSRSYLSIKHKNNQPYVMKRILVSMIWTVAGEWWKVTDHQFSGTSHKGQRNFINSSSYWKII